MAAFLNTFVLSLFPDECYDEFFKHRNFFHEECLKTLICKVLGFGIILGSILVKVPQIVKIVKAGSGEGINFLSVFMELVAITVSVAYNYAKMFPFSSWGEGLFLMLQTAAIACLVLYFETSVLRLTVFVLVYNVLFVALFSGLVPLYVLAAVQVINVPVMVSSKLVQALENYRNGNTGQLSAITVFLMFGGSVARIFTSIQETGDLIIVVTFMCTTVANGIVAFQMLYFWRATDRHIKGE